MGSYCSNQREVYVHVQHNIDLPQDFLCPITQEPIHEPVIAADGHTYQRKAILQWLQRNNTSPFTGERLANNNIVPNHTLKKVMEEYLRAIKKFESNQSENKSLKVLIQMRQKQMQSFIKKNQTNRATPLSKKQLFEREKSDIQYSGYRNQSQQKQAKKGSKQQNRKSKYHFRNKQDFKQWQTSVLRCQQNQKSSNNIKHEQTPGIKQKMNKQLIFKKFDNGTYHGQIKNGKMHGQGKYTWEKGQFSGDIYQGQWKQGLMDGFGHYRCNNGDEYKGQWYKGMKEGRGSYYKNGDGSVQQGIWKKDQLIR